jgi:hypothetical protein
VTEKIVGTKRQNDGIHLYRISWYGYGLEDDTWEPSDKLPKSMLRSYHKRTGIPLTALPRTYCLSTDLFGKWPISAPHLAILTTDDGVRILHQSRMR